MLDVVVTTLLAPALVAAATLAGRRWGAALGGVVSAFPAIVGPVLVIDVLERGVAFTVRAAAGTLLGLVGLAVFVVVYGQVAVRASWPAALAAAWLAAALTTVVLAGVEVGIGPGAGVACAALVLAVRALRNGGGAPVTPVAPAAGVPGAGRELALRMAACALLVVALAAAAGLVGPFAGGMLAALPVLASVLAVFTHRASGACATVALLRGMLGGMGSFVAFCVVAGVLLEPAGPVAAFALAAVAALTAQAVASAAHVAQQHRDGPAGSPRRDAEKIAA